LLLVLLASLLPLGANGQAVATLRDQLDSLQETHPEVAALFVERYKEVFGPYGSVIGSGPDGITIENPPNETLLRHAGWSEERISAAASELREILYGKQSHLESRFDEWFAEKLQPYGFAIDDPVYKDDLRAVGFTDSQIAALQLEVHALIADGGAEQIPVPVPIPPDLTPYHIFSPDGPDCGGLLDTLASNYIGQVSEADRNTMCANGVAQTYANDFVILPSQCFQCAWLNPEPEPEPPPEGDPPGEPCDPADEPPGYEYNPNPVPPPAGCQTPPTDPIFIPIPPCTDCPPEEDPDW